MTSIVKRTTVFDLADGFDVNNDCLKLLVDSIETSEMETPDGFITLLNAVMSIYGELTRDLQRMVKN